jgi:hypothetical protein
MKDNRYGSSILISPCNEHVNDCMHSDTAIHTRSARSTANNAKVYDQVARPEHAYVNYKIPFDCHGLQSCIWSITSPNSAVYYCNANLNFIRKG